MRTTPFGRHRGERVSDLPDEYLLWLSSVDIRNSKLHAAVLEEIERRRLEEERSGRDDFVDRLNAPRLEVAEQLIGAGLRTLARKHHPDAGGDSRKMVELNNAADWLRQRVRAVG